MVMTIIFSSSRKAPVGQRSIATTPNQPRRLPSLVLSRSQLPPPEDSPYASEYRVTVSLLAVKLELPIVLLLLFSLQLPWNS